MFNPCPTPSSKDQLYMIEFLVHELTVFPDRAPEVTGSLYISLKFASLPAFVIRQEDFATVKPPPLDPNDKAETIPFDVGKSCIFSCHPSELTTWIQEEPARIEVYKTRASFHLCDSDPPETPLCSTQISLSECLCDYGTIAQSGELSEPKSVRNTYSLLDCDLKPFGAIRIFLRLSCFGKLIVTRFALQKDSFLFKTGHSLNEFQCIKVPLDDGENNSVDDSNVESESTRNNGTESSSLNTGSILGLSLVCEDLARSDGGPPLNVPEMARMVDGPKNGVGRRRGFRMKSNFEEEDCQCVGGNAGKANLKCSWYCEDKSGCDENGEKEEFGLKERDLGGKMGRMRGGGCDPKDDYNDLERKTCPCETEDTLPTNNCCSCDSNTLTLQNKDSCSCNDPQVNYTGVSSFQKCLNEAQAILNSLGNKNGFAGLGILGPLESPYFGRKREIYDAAPPPKTTTEQDFARLPINKLLVPGYKDTATRESEAAPHYEAPLATNKYRKTDSRVDRHEEEPPSKIRESDAMKLLGGPTFPDTGISTVFQKDDYMKFPSNQVSDIHVSKDKMHLKKKKKKRKHFGKRKKNFNVKAYASEVSASSLKSAVKVSKRVMKHTFAMREYNPGIYHGHRDCLNHDMRIPPNMGWLWNVGNDPGISRPRYGWKPGAISKYVYELLMKAKSESGVASSGKVSGLETSVGKKLKQLKSKSHHSLSLHSSKHKAWDEQSEEKKFPPLVQIHRKDGDYYVTINPAKPGDHHHPVKPLQLKISKNETDGDDVSNSTAPDFQMACSPPGFGAAEHKAESKDVDTQVKQQEILDATRQPKVPKAAGAKGKKGKAKK